MFFRRDKTVQEIWGHLARAEFDEALQRADAALKTAEDPYRYYRVLGFAHVRMERLDAAVDCFTRALALRPDDLRATLALANALYTDGRFEEARAHFECIVRKRPRFGVARKKLMAIYKQLGLMDEFYRTKAEADLPALMPYALRRRLLGYVARAYSRTYRPPLHGKLIFWKGIPLARGIALPCLLAGKHIRRTTHGVESTIIQIKAEGLFQLLLDDGNRDEAAALIDYLVQDAELTAPVLEQLARDFAEEGRPGKTVEMLERLGTFAGLDVDLQILLAKARLQLDDRDEAETALASALQDMPDAPSITLMLQGCEAMRSSRQAAIQAWREALAHSAGFTPLLMLLRSLRHAEAWGELDAAADAPRELTDRQRALVLREKGLGLLARGDLVQGKRRLLEASKLDTSLFADADDVLSTAKYRQRGHLRDIDGADKPRIAVVSAEYAPLPEALAALSGSAHLYLYHPDEGPALYRDAPDLDGVIVLEPTPDLERDLRHCSGLVILPPGCGAGVTGALSADTPEAAARMCLDLIRKHPPAPAPGPLAVRRLNGAQEPALPSGGTVLLLAEHDAPARSGGTWRMENGMRMVQGRMENAGEIIRLLSELHGPSEILFAPDAVLPRRTAPATPPVATAPGHRPDRPASLRGKRVVMTVNNPGTTDNRVFKAAQAAVRNGYECHLVGFLRDGFPAREIVEGVHLHRIAPPPISELPWRWALRRPPRPVAVDPGAGADASRKTAPAVPPPWRTLAEQFFQKVANAMRSMGQLPRMQQWQYFHTFYTQIVSLKPDLIHCHDLWPLQACVAAAEATGAKVIYDSHELEAHRNIQWTTQERRCWAGLESRLLPKLDGVITVSDGIARELETQFKRRRVEVIHNTPWRPEASACGADVRSAAGIAEDVPLIVYVGFITFGRGVEKLVQSMRHYPEAHVALVGPARADMLSKFRELAQIQGAEDRLHILPPVPAADLIPFLSTADVSAIIFQGTCLSHYYIKPNKLFESVFAGLPVVVPPFPDIARFVVENDVGCVFTSDAPEDLAQALRMTAGEKGRFFQGPRMERLRDYYCYENCVRQLAELYASVLKDG